MKNKTTTARKGTATEPEDLAVLLTKVLDHPQLPDELENAIGETLCEMYSYLSSKQQRRLDTDLAHIARLLALSNENAKGGAR